MSHQPKQPSWDERFARDDYVYGEQPNVWIEQNLPALGANAQVLAIADGEGRNTVWLAKQGYRATNWDYSQVGIQKTQQLAQAAGVQVSAQVIDLIHDPLPEVQFDAMVASFFHLPKAHQQTSWQNLLTRLNPGGYLVVQVFDEAQLPNTSGGPKSLDLLYNLDFWQDLLATWQVDICQVCYDDLDEGPLHQGRACVINIKATKLTTV